MWNPCIWTANHIYTFIYICAFMLSHVPLSVTQWTVVHQAPLSMEFSRQEYWSELPFLSPGDLPKPGIEPWSSALKADSLPTELQGKPSLYLLLLMPNSQSFPPLPHCWQPQVSSLSQQWYMFKLWYNLHQDAHSILGCRPVSLGKCITIPPVKREKVSITAVSLATSVDSWLCKGLT